MLDALAKDRRGKEQMSRRAPFMSFQMLVRILSGKSADWQGYDRTGSDLCMYLLEHANVALVTGEAFGDSNCIRISYAASEETLN